MSGVDELTAAVEAILFAAGEPVPRERLAESFEESEREAVQSAVDRILERYRGMADCGLIAEEVAGGVRLATRPELAPYLRRFFEVTSRSKLSMAALETLAIVAYRQPITGPEVAELRGVNSHGVIQTLLERRLIRIAGRRPVVGKPFVYRTTTEFLTQFGLDTLKDLPPLEDFEEALGLEAMDRQEELPLPEDGSPADEERVEEEVEAP